MLQPLLFIGLGGAGGKTLRAIKQQLHSELTAHGHSQGLPSAWQFLHVDTPTVQNGESFPAPMLPAQEYYSVVPYGITLQDIIGRVESRAPQLETQKMLAGWSTESSPIPINRGAGQIRAIGRLALVSDLENTFATIQRAISRMLSPDAFSELQAVSSTLGFKLEESTPQVFIVTSLGGGSGSGMFLDVAELVKRATPAEWGSQTISLLYSSEIFRSLMRMGKSIPMNSLGAMNELIASEGTGLSASTNLLYSKFGISPSRDDRENTYGGRSNILVGPRSGEMDEIIFDFGTTFAKAIAQGKVSEFLVNLISLHNSQSVISSDDAGLATGVLSFDGASLPGPQTIMPLWSDVLFADSILREAAEARFQMQTWGYFWEGRRARPLTESIPLETETRRSMIAGWTIASLLGMRKVTSGPSGHSVKVWNPTLNQPGWSTFPDPLLLSHRGNMSDQGSVLPQLLLSTGLALVEFGRTGDVTFINGYRLLKHLGSEVTSQADRRHWDSDRGTRVSWKQTGESTYISEWIQKGVRPDVEIELPKSNDEEHATPLGRAQSLNARVEIIRGHYSQRWQELEGKPWHQMPAIWELREDVDLALSDITEYLKKFLS